MRHGGHIVVDQLRALGVRRVFTVPGESFLPVLDALFDRPDVQAIVCRHEGGAAMMAEATGKLTGQPGIAIVTRGPGATNAMSGLHVARQDQTPMLLLVGLHAQHDDNREAFQEIDIGALFGSVAKWTAVVRSLERLPELLARAWHTALSGRPGPVVLGLPEDVLAAESDAPVAPCSCVARPAPDRATMERVASMLATAERPMVIAGGPGWSEAAARDLASFATRFDIPVAAAFRRQDSIDNRHPCYVGHLGLAIDAPLAAGVRDADLVIAIATRLDEITTGGYDLLRSPGQRIVHAHPCADEAGRSIPAALAVVATADAFTAALAGLEGPASPRPWAQRRRDLRAAYAAWSKPVARPRPARLASVVRTLSDTLPDAAIVTNGAGNYAAFLHRHFTYKRAGTQLAPASGSMGYGLPAAIAAKLASPEVPVVALAGDGCLMMTVQELATAVQHRAAIVVVVANNAMYGTIRMHQERTFPGRVSATDLVNPDLVALALSFGAFAERVDRADAFEPALQRAMASGSPALIEVVVDPEAITPAATLSEIRAGQEPGAAKS
ncbi:MAG: thiamine pyrophosphate-dependent enzyme [Pseudomonadota bacterium]